VLRALPFSCLLGILTGLAPVWELGAVGLLAWSGAYTLVVVNGISYRQTSPLRTAPESSYVMHLEGSDPPDA